MRWENLSRAQRRLESSLCEGARGPRLPESVGLGEVLCVSLRAVLLVFLLTWAFSTKKRMGLGPHPTPFSFADSSFLFWAWGKFRAFVSL